MRVLAIGCHPDDIEIACSGTLVKCIKRGDEVYCCHLANGDLGHVVIQPDELGKIRIQEAKDAGKVGGVKEVIWGGFHDLKIFSDNEESQNKVVEIIRKVNPDFIITHDPNDYIPDHRAVSKLVFAASFAATCPHYPPQTDKPARLVPIYYMDTLAGVNFVPTEFVDITDEIETKINMLECHKSQLVWMREHDNIDFADMVRTCSKYRGYQCGATYAEGFTQCNVYLKNTTKRLLP